MFDKIKAFFWGGGAAEGKDPHSSKFFRIQDQSLFIMRFLKNKKNSGIYIVLCLPEYIFNIQDYFYQCREKGRLRSNGLFQL